MGVFESYLEEFSQSISPLDFFINLIVTAILCILLRFFYSRFGHAVSNRNRFGNIFLPLGLTTLLIITIVKSSIALSLGLVGALSIVRFRAAIKDPEELTYLFLCIGIGLAAGADQLLIGSVAFFFILGVLYLNERIWGKRNIDKKNKMFLHIRTDIEDLGQVSKALTDRLPYVELKRMDKNGEGLDLSFSIEAHSLAELEYVKETIGKLSDKTTFSLVDRPELFV